MAMLNNQKFFFALGSRGSPLKIEIRPLILTHKTGDLQDSSCHGLRIGRRLVSQTGEYSGSSFWGDGNGSSNFVAAHL